MKVFFFPPCPREGYVNPYCTNYKKSLDTYFSVEERDNPVTKMKSLTLMHYAFRSDVFILNWIENAHIWTWGILQFFLVILSLLIIKARGKKIVWMLHNMNPHEGKSWYSNFIKNWLFKNASFIISHSNDAANAAKKRANCKVEYICHPVCMPKLDAFDGSIEPCDILIWGSILPYKGIAEFLEQTGPKLNSKKILVLGKCSDEKLKQKIEKCAESANVTFKNRFASFGEIAAYVKNAKYVLFPYIGNCVSSSGVLMDTIAMNGGFPVGPNKGAFKDLAHEGVCETYETPDDLLSILNREPPKKNIVDFSSSHSWNAFAKQLFDIIQTI